MDGIYVLLQLYNLRKFKTFFHNILYRHWLFTVKKKVKPFQICQKNLSLGFKLVFISTGFIVFAVVLVVFYIISATLALP